jgi:hypothetical protein
MSRQSRQTLKGYFRAGRRPTEDEFGDLIDSALNITDEGFAKTVKHGLQVTSLGASSALMGFFSPRSEGQDAEWSFGFREGRLDQLAFRRPAGGDVAAPLLLLQGPQIAPVSPDAFHRNGRVGIGVTEPEATLDVAGAVRAFGRRGREPLYADGRPRRLVANGKFQAITGPLRGCHAFEVVAGVGDRHSGRFALVHATVLNTFNPIWWDNVLGLKKRIRAQHAYYTSRADRLQLRWMPYRPGDDPVAGHGDRGAYQLEIRSRRDYRADDRDGDKLKGSALEVPIRAYVTQLWFDDLTGEPNGPGQMTASEAAHLAKESAEEARRAVEAAANAAEAARAALDREQSAS